MAGTPVGTTYSLPNYVGELFGQTPEDTPLLSAIGGLAGAKVTRGTQFEWQTYDLRDAVANNSVVEDANAPTATARVRGQVSNVVEIHRSKVRVSYSKQAAIGQLGTGPAPVYGSATQPVTDELSWQIAQEVKAVARDIDKSFIEGVYQRPTDNNTARKTRGLLAAVTTNVASCFGPAQALATSADSDDIVDTTPDHGFFAGDQVQFLTKTGGSNVEVGKTYYVLATSLAAKTFKIAETPGGSAVNFGSDITAGTVAKLTALTSGKILDLMQAVWTNGGIREQEAATLVCNAWAKRVITKAFITDANYRETSRNVGGVNLSTIETDFGRLNVMLDRHMPVHKLAVVSLEQLAPVFLEIPGKGLLFADPLANTGGGYGVEVYGEVGLEYGNELAHGVISDFATIVPPTA